MMRLSPRIWPLWAHIAALVLAMAGLAVLLAPLNASYLASGHPADHATGQLAFDAERLRGYFAAMQRVGGLDHYRHSQILDFGLLVLIGLFIGLSGTLIARLSMPGQLGQRLGSTAAGIGIAGAVCDAMENLISLMFLADPRGITQAWAMGYSGFAAAKFTLLALALAAILASLLLGMRARISAD